MNAVLRLRCCRAPAPAESIDVSSTRGAQQQTHRTPQRLSNDGLDRRTEGRPIVT